MAIAEELGIKSRLKLRDNDDNGDGGKGVGCERYAVSIDRSRVRGLG